MSTDETWKRIGSENPFFGVLTNPKYKGKDLDQDLKKEFYETGEYMITHVHSRMKALFPSFDPSNLTALDFGCGVGRLLLPIAKRTRKAIGVDISPGMLEQASRAAQDVGLHNVELVVSDPKVTGVKEALNWINSLIVFQHIPLESGYRLFDSLLSKLNGPSYISTQFTIFKNPKIIQHLPEPLFVKQVEIGEYWLGGVSMSFENFTADGMAMYDYDLDQIVAIMVKHGFLNFTCEVISMGVSVSVLIYAHRA